MGRESFSRYQSYTAQIERRKKMGRLFRTFLLIFFIYALFQSLFLRTLKVSNEAMAPEFSSGDMVVSIPLLAGPRVPFFGWSLPSVRGLERGDVVEVIPSFVEEAPFWISGPDEILRFVTLNNFSLHGGREKWVFSQSIKRIIGLPGDRVRVKDFVAYIQPSGERSFLSEYELSPKRYDVDKGILPQGWRETDPLGAGADEVLLGPDEYYVLGDNRGASSDSRLWGVVKARNILGLVVLQYWPLGEFGLP